jgi:hypothetical protein
VISKETGEGAFAMSLTMMAFSPLSAMSPSARDLQRKLSSSLHDEKKDKKYSASVQKQHNIILEHIEKERPSCEHLFAQGNLVLKPESTLI